MVSMIARLRKRSLSVIVSKRLRMFLRSLVIRRRPWRTNNSSARALGDVPAIAEELAEEAPHQAWDRTAVVDVAAGQAEGQQLAAVVDDQVQLEAVEPADRGLAPRGVEGEDAMLPDAGVVADRQRRRVDEADARAVPELGVQVDGERNEHRSA